MKEALHYVKMVNNKVQCKLCPHNCIIVNGKPGICLVRKNFDGILYTMVYGRPAAMHTDPIEKKPLYHFFPGSKILSIGTFGCNLKCSFCQNCEISQVFPESVMVSGEKPVQEIVNEVLIDPYTIGLAYTYNEPLMFFEYMMDLARAIKKNKLKNVMVSNGFINQEPLGELLEVIDAFNIDLKSFNNYFYTTQTKSFLPPVLDTISAIIKRGRHLELTFLAIPGLNDSRDEFEKMTDWILENCGRKTILHISKYFPAYHLDAPPTPLKLLEDLYAIAKKKLDFVYIGNTGTSIGRDTICPVCGNILISRSGYIAGTIGLSASGNCLKCDEHILTYS